MTGYLYLVYPNKTSQTGRASQIVRVARGTLAASVASECGGNAHNFVPWNGHHLWCDSLSGTLACDGKPVFRVEPFTRGLFVSADYILVGGSAREARSEREGKDGYIWVLNPRFELVTEIKIPGVAPPCEIRRSRRWTFP